MDNEHSRGPDFSMLSSSQATPRGRCLGLLMPRQQLQLSHPQVSDLCIIKVSVSGLLP